MQRCCMITDLVLRLLVISVQWCKVNVTRSHVNMTPPRSVICAEYAVNDECREGEHQRREACGMFNELAEILRQCLTQALGQTYTFSLRSRVSNTKPASGIWFRGKGFDCCTDRA